MDEHVSSQIGLAVSRAGQDYLRELIRMRELDGPDFTLSVVLVDDEPSHVTITYQPTGLTVTAEAQGAAEALIKAHEELVEKLSSTVNNLDRAVGDIDPLIRQAMISYAVAELESVAVEIDQEIRELKETDRVISGAWQMAANICRRHALDLRNQRGAR